MKLAKEHGVSARTIQHNAAFVETLEPETEAGILRGELRIAVVKRERRKADPEAPQAPPLTAAEASRKVRDLVERLIERLPDEDKPVFAEQLQNLATRIRLELELDDAQTGRQPAN